MQDNEHKQGKKIDITGKRFGRLVAIEEAYRIKEKTYWKCRCDCGQEVAICKSSLLYGQTRSCGCLKRELLIARNRAKRGVKIEDNKLYNSNL